MSELKECPNCNNKIKGGIFNSNNFLSEEKVAIINVYHDKKSNSYCDKCGDELFVKYKNALLKEKKQLKEKFLSIINSIPVITTHSPLNWNYEIIDMVTAQSSTGTGVLTELSSSFSDFFGMQSDRLSNKIKHGEDLCFSKLRKRVLDVGGNAVIATDVDYSEIGGDKGILMVCMGGTAIKLLNTDILGKEREEHLSIIEEINARILFLEKYNLASYEAV
ncbi:heavy metal-binding domain-containing protein [Flavobacterium sp.]|uniref:heavy metal-binding domain-containing protein n=1 Tax=Flavobacterium sp. TaxID=239 RepID=UPI002623AE11|nr:heavy metal-binding domain-containing protein [Flavobacterium sp.]